MYWNHTHQCLGFTAESFSWVTVINVGYFLSAVTSVTAFGFLFAYVGYLCFPWPPNRPRQSLHCPRHILSSPAQKSMLTKSWFLYFVSPAMVMVKRHQQPDSHTFLRAAQKPVVVVQERRKNNVNLCHQFFSFVIELVGGTEKSSRVHTSTINRSERLHLKKLFLHIYFAKNG